MGPFSLSWFVCDNVRPKMALISVKKSEEKKNTPSAQTMRLVSFGLVLVDTAHPDFIISLR